jgi:hypothetical protein
MYTLPSLPSLAPRPPAPQRIPARPHGCCLACSCVRFIRLPTIFLANEHLAVTYRPLTLRYLEPVLALHLQLLWLLLGWPPRYRYLNTFCLALFPPVQPLQSAPSRFVSRIFSTFKRISPCHLPQLPSPRQCLWRFASSPFFSSRPPSSFFCRTASHLVARSPPLARSR